MLSYFTHNDDTKDTNSNEKQPDKCILTAKSKIPNFPSKIIKPTEQKRYENLTENETNICKYLSTNYATEISNFTFWTDDIIPRFVTDTYYITNYQKRLELTNQRFKQYLKHRTEFHFDNILTLPSLNTAKQQQILQENSKIFSLYYYGIDKEGHPLVWDSGASYGHGDIITRTFCADNFQRASFWRSRLKRKEANLFLKINAHYGAKISKIILIADIKNVGVTDFYKNRAFTQWNLRTTSELFPETLHKIFIINAPWAFQMIWKICCNFLDEITVKKTIILGADYLEEITKYIDINMIPREFGGMGMWEPRPGNVPINFPFQMEHMDADIKVNDECTDDIKDVIDGMEMRQYVYKNINYDNNDIICLDEKFNDIVFQLPNDKNVLQQIKQCIDDGINQQKDVMVIVSIVRTNNKKIEIVYGAKVVIDAETT